MQQLEYELRRVKGDLHRTCFELENEIRSKKDTIRSLQHENANIVRELQEYKNLSEIRGRKLIGAQVFLTKPDLLSISDVKDMVNTLNDENFQASASLGDALVHSKYELDKEEWAAAYAQVCRTVSEPLANALRKETQKPEPEVNLLLVQVVLEMYLVHFCSSLIESWFPNTRETSDFLSTIYSEIRRTGEFIFVRYRLPLISIVRGTSCIRQMAGINSRTDPPNFDDMERRIYVGSWSYLQDRCVGYRKSRQFKGVRTETLCHFQSSRGFEAGVGGEDHIHRS